MKTIKTWLKTIGWIIILPILVIVVAVYVFFKGEKS